MRLYPGLDVVGLLWLCERHDPQTLVTLQVRKVRAGWQAPWDSTVLMPRSEQAAERLSGSQDLILENPEEAKAAVCRVGRLENSVGSGILVCSGFQHVDSLLKREKESWGAQSKG